MLGADVAVGRGAQQDVGRVNRPRLTAFDEAPQRQASAGMGRAQAFTRPVARKMQWLLNSNQWKEKMKKGLELERPECGSGCQALAALGCFRGAGHRPWFQ